jgi:hypothetical protein
LKACQDHRAPRAAPSADRRRTPASIALRRAKKKTAGLHSSLALSCHPSTMVHAILGIRPLPACPRSDGLPGSHGPVIRWF